MKDFFLTFFTKDNDKFSRFDENHTERAYSIEEISELIKKAGMKLLKVYDSLSFDSPTDKSERVFFVVQEQGKGL